MANKTFLSADWEKLIMANYEVDASILKSYLPSGVELDYFDGKTYASLVGFMFNNTRLFNIPIPFFGTFEEINLRFYVKRVEDDVIKRGVVFITETVPYKVVAWLANRLYKERYIAIPTKNIIVDVEGKKSIRYEWKINNQWNHIAAQTETEPEQLLNGSMEEFIFEHYYGFTKINDKLSQEYRVNHPRWLTNKVLEYSVNCDFDLMYGEKFSFLNKQTPASVFVAQGSPVTVDWKRTFF